MRSSVTTTAAVLGIIALSACDDSASNHPAAPAALRTTQLASSGAFVADVGNDTTAQNETPIAVNPARYPDVNFSGAMQFVEWITGEAGRRAIAEFRINGEQLFFPNSR